MAGKAKSIDYKLYLVTDNTPAILGDRDLVEVVKAAVDGGVTIVQLRDKTSDTGHLIRIARSLHSITSAAGIPLLINDRVDVALAAGVEGVHIGQDDISLSSARAILGPDAIIGVTANNVQEALQAARNGADYLGVGTVFATPTKENTKSIIGTAGVRDILAKLDAEGLGGVKTVCIGGINLANVQRVMYQTTTAKGKRLDGVAVVSAIMAAKDPRRASEEFLRKMDCPAPWVQGVTSTDATTRARLTKADILSRAPELVKSMAERKPLCHNMTNLVVQNIAANVVIAIGGSPIMSNNGLEAGDLAALNGSLVINMGTSTTEGRRNYIQAITAYNAVGGPVLFDPVGAAATQERRDTIRELMAAGYFTVIKGNEGEIRAVSGATGVTQHGVDSGAAQLSLEERIALVKDTAARERNVIVMSGAVDVVSDGVSVVTIENGDELLGEITGSGCSLGATIAAFLAYERKETLLATVTGMLMYEIAAERAARRNDVRGPGTFVPAFIDELYGIRRESAKGESGWIEAARVTVV